ncbi:MAG: ABC transporter ATP-binding protein [Thermoguttaceae bacterium]|nr:ABC transporter ATP-binding protein [Thermoguttaceae bacterium]
MIKIVNFTKHYGQRVAVDRLNLLIEPGEIFGFVGPNGAGKTTTIRFLATLIRPTEGEGWICGYSVVREPLAARRVLGYMPDSFGAYLGMRVKDFLEFFAEIHGVPRPLRKQAISRVGDRLELGPVWNEYVTRLSRGMKQRLSLAQALIHDPPVLILDEPASGLDPKARIELKRLLLELRAAGKTILISSHILAELADWATTVGIIHKGRLLLRGPLRVVAQHLRPVRRIHIRFSSDPEKVIRIVESIPGVRWVLPQDGAVTAELEAGDSQLADLLRKLVKEDVQVFNFAEEEPSLEEIFLLATGAGGPGSAELPGLGSSTYRQADGGLTGGGEFTSTLATS